MGKYAVVSTYNFDSETHCYLFDTEAEAIEFLEKYWQWSFNLALDDDNFNEELSYHDERYGRVSWGYDGEDVREFQVVKVENTNRFI